MGINIGFDADGVLFDTEKFQISEKAISYMEKHFQLSVSNQNGYGVKDVYSCTKQMEMAFWTHFVIRYSLFFRARPLVKETIGLLRRQGNKVFIVTSKACALEKNYKGIAVRFLFELGLKLNGIFVDGIEYCTVENSAEDKLQACRKKNIRIMVEDKWENVDRLKEELQVICFATRNNGGYHNKDVYRAGNFNEVYGYIKKMIGKETGQRDAFTEYSPKSKMEKKNMPVEERKEYQKMLRTYYSALPIRKEKILRSEKLTIFLSRFYAPVFRHFCNPVIIGMENIPNQKGILFVCNHLCSKDVPFLLYALYPCGIPWHPLAKTELLREMRGIPFRMAYSVFVDRADSASRHLATQELAKLLVNGYNVLIFPEGTYNKTENLLKEFSGVSHVYLSQILQVPIVNCALTKDYRQGPVLRIDKPYIVSPETGIEEAAEDSFARLLLLVEKNRQQL